MLYIRHLWITLTETLLGFVGGSIVALVLGTLIALSRRCEYFRLFRISSGCTAGSSAGASPAKRTLDACRGSKLMQGWLRQNAAISPARLSEL
jgi:hypothetical protein